MSLLVLIRETILSTARDVAPIIAILAFFQFAVLRRRLPNLRRIVVGLAYVLIGMTLFLIGLEQALFPLGRSMAEQLAAPTLIEAGSDVDWRDYGLVYAFAAAIGFATTVAEPALIAVALKANQVSGGTIPVLGLRLAVATGVAVGVALGCFRIVTGTSLPLYIIVGYVLVVLQTATAPRRIVPLAFDSGGVTTSTVTVPVVTALGLGLAATIPGRHPLIDGFGLIAFASLCPIMSVLAYGWLADAARRTPRRNRDQ